MAPALDWCVALFAGPWLRSTRAISFQHADPSPAIEEHVDAAPNDGSQQVALAASSRQADDDVDASGVSSRSLFTKSFAAKSRLSDAEILERTKHLRLTVESDLSATLPPGWADGLSKEVAADIEASAATDIRSSVVAGCFGQILCSGKFVQNITYNQLIATDLGSYQDTYSSTENCTIYEGIKLVECTEGNITSRWQHTGDEFGCVHRSQTYHKYDTPYIGWKPFSDPARAGCDPDGTAAQTINRINTELDRAAASRSEVSASEQEIAIAGMPGGPFLHYVVNKVMEQGGSYAVVASLGGKVIERYAKNVTRTTRLHGWSMSKSVLSLLLGSRHAEGQLEISAFVKAPEVNQSMKKLRQMTITNLMNMRTGSPAPEFSLAGLSSAVWSSADSAGAAALGAPLRPPQDHSWAYSSGNANILSRELRYTFPSGPAGLSEYASYPWTALFSKIGASSFTCESDAAGTLLFSGYCYASARDWLRIGELVAQKGRWGPNGEIVVPEEWIEKTTAVYEEGPHSEYTHLWYRLDQVYGYNTPVLAARGTDGQELIIVPAYGLVLTRLGKKPAKFLDKVNMLGDTLFSELLDALSLR